MRSLFKLSIAVFTALMVLSCGSSRPRGNCTYKLLLEASTASPEAIEKVSESIMKRFDLAGYTSADIDISKNDSGLEITIKNYSDAENRNYIRNLCISQGNLEFWEVYENNAEMIALLEKVNTLIARQSTRGNSNGEITEEIDTTTLKGKVAAASKQSILDESRKDNPLFAILAPGAYQTAEGFKVMEGGVIGWADVSDTANVLQYLTMAQEQEVLPDDIIFCWGAYPVKGQSTTFELYGLQKASYGKGPALSGDVIAAAHPEFDPSGRVVINMQMTREAGYEWRKVTRRNINQCIAMVIDRKVMSAPNVMGEITGGASSITGQFTQKEAEEIILTLKSALPVSLKLVDEKLSCP